MINKYEFLSGLVIIFCFFLAVFMGQGCGFSFGALSITIFIFWLFRDTICERIVENIRDFEKELDLLEEARRKREH